MPYSFADLRNAILPVSDEPVPRLVKVILSNCCDDLRRQARSRSHFERNLARLEREELRPLGLGLRREEETEERMQFRIVNRVTGEVVEEIAC